MRSYSTRRAWVTSVVAAVSALSLSAVAVASASASVAPAPVRTAGTVVASTSDDLRWVKRNSTRLTARAAVGSRVVANPSDGKRVRVVSRKGDRLKVRLPSGREGWTGAGNLTRVPMADVKGTWYTEGKVVVRAGMSSSTKAIAGLRLGSEVARMARTTEGSATKLKVRLADGRVGWMPTGRVTTRDVWGDLGRCESGGNPRINTGNGYYGLYQFTARTWRAVGGSQLPHQKPADEQTKRAQILQGRAGWGQWPSCTRKLGLS